MIEARGLSKRYGDTLAVDDLSFTVQPGVVTGFLGPNGAGKSTTMRMLLGLDRPTRGTSLISGKLYSSLKGPLHHVGALLDGSATRVQVAPHLQTRQRERGHQDERRDRRIAPGGQGKAQGRGALLVRPQVERGRGR